MGGADIEPEISQGAPKAGSAALTFDLAAYLHYVEDFDLTEAEQAKLLEELWAVMVAWVDLGLRIHPVQQATGAAGPENLAPDSGAMLASKGSSNKNNNKMSAHRSRELAGGE